jgi:protein involved in polysaccharide export with SLBB domain
LAVFTLLFLLPSTPLWAAGKEVVFRNITKPSKKPNTNSWAQLKPDAFMPAGLTNQLLPDWLQAPKEPYRLGPGDMIEIEMIGEAAGRSSVQLGPDGKIYYSLLPGLRVWGLTLNETRLALEEGLKKFLRQAPDITVSLKSANSKNVWLLGNVEKPGVYPLNTPLTVMDLITMSGGPLNFAGAKEGLCDLRRSFIMRDGKLLGVDFDQLLRSGDLTQNIYLKPNDFIYLRSAQTLNIYVMGAVGMPTVVAYTDRMSLLTAIASVGGTVPYAHLSQVTIIRGSLITPNVATVDLGNIMKGKQSDYELSPGDIVYVPFVPWKKIATIAEDMLNQFIYTTAANEGYRSVQQGGTITPSIGISPSITR